MVGAPNIFLNTVYFRRGLRCTLGLINDELLRKYKYNGLILWLCFPFYVKSDYFHGRQSLISGWKTTWSWRPEISNLRLGLVTRLTRAVLIFQYWISLGAKTGTNANKLLPKRNFLLRLPAWQQSTRPTSNTRTSSFDMFVFFHCPLQKLVQVAPSWVSFECCVVGARLAFLYLLWTPSCPFKSKSS